MQIPSQYKFIVELGKALHVYGVPSYKSQLYLSEVAALKNIKGSFMDTPTWINYTFYEENDHTYNYVECVPPGELNLGALSRVVEVTKSLLADEIDFKQAKQELKAIKSAKIGYSPLIELVSYMTSAGAFAVLLDTSWASVMVSAGIGALVYGLTRLSRKSAYIKSTLESLASLMATLIIGLLSLVIPQLNISMSILASIIVFIPGLAITTALEEITSKSLVSGTAKLFDALISLFKQVFGVVLGLAVISIFVELSPNNVINDIPQWVDYFAVILLAGSLLPVFKVRLKDMPLSILIGFSCFIVTSFLDFAGLMLSIFMGTLTVVFLSKYFSSLTKTPRLVYLTPGIIMLVPGSKAFITISTVFLDSQAPTANNMGLQVFYIFMGIIGGLIFSGAFMNKSLLKK